MSGAPGTIDFEGRAVAIEDGDTLASALYRSGVRTFTRSLKYHRRRGLYCLTGDCPNCLLSVDREPAVRACCTPAREGMVVKRESGWPSAERDLLAVNDRLHWALPAGFYYKTFLRPAGRGPTSSGSSGASRGSGRSIWRGRRRSASSCTSIPTCS